MEAERWGSIISTLLSFVIPCYRSEFTIEKVVKEIRDIVSERDGYDYEIICVNDCSPDAVYPVLVNLAAEDSRILVVNLSKNMGKHSAVLAGYAYATGEYIVNLDDDCQCPTNELWRLLEPLETQDYDIATANYLKKKQAAWKNFGSSFNAHIGELIFDKPHGLRFENFCIIKRYVADEMRQYPNAFPYLEGLMLRITSKITTVEMEERERGDSKLGGFNFRKSVSLFTNGFTAFSVKPLRISMFIGIFTAIAGFTLGAVMIIRKLINPDVLMGYTSTIVIQLFIGGLILMSLGMIGEYIGRMYICLNKAPQYVVKNTINLSGENTAHEKDLVGAQRKPF